MLLIRNFLAFLKLFFISFYGKVISTGKNAIPKIKETVKFIKNGGNKVIDLSTAGAKKLSSYIDKQLDKKEVKEEISAHADQAFRGSAQIISTPLNIATNLISSNKYKSKLSWQIIDYNLSYVGILFSHNLAQYLVKSIARSISPTLGMVTDYALQAEEYMFNAYLLRKLIQLNIFSVMHMNSATSISSKKSSIESLPGNNCDCGGKKLINANAISPIYYLTNLLFINIVKNSLPVGGKQAGFLLNSLLNGWALAEYKLGNKCNQHREEFFRKNMSYFLSSGISMQVLEGITKYGVEKLIPGANKFGLKAIISLLYWPFYIIANKIPQHMQELKYGFTPFKLANHNTNYVLREYVSKIIIPIIEKNGKNLEKVKKSLQDPRVAKLAQLILSKEIASEEFFLAPPNKLFLEITKFDESVKSCRDFLYWLHKTNTGSICKGLADYTIGFFPSSILDKNTKRLIVGLLRKKDLYGAINYLNKLVHVTSDKVKIVKHDFFKNLKHIENHFKKPSNDEEYEVSRKVFTGIYIIENHFKRAKEFSWKEFDKKVEDNQERINRDFLSKSVYIPKQHKKKSEFGTNSVMIFSNSKKSQNGKNIEKNNIYLNAENDKTKQLKPFSLQRKRNDNKKVGKIGVCVKNKNLKLKSDKDTSVVDLANKVIDKLEKSRSNYKLNIFDNYF